ncbi:MAG: hypothetical protein PHU44_05265 [Syntrophales bacterium]|nr:hypothetical protein [Syntrophales bacterium]MDD5641285.1 hypothetical protein [Syntrophales bacterium]
MNKIKDILKESKGITPLGLVATFVSLTEIILVIATTQTTGFIQVILTIFVILYALLIPGVFFIILWKKAGVFYPPKDFRNGVEIDQYVKALHSPATCSLPSKSESPRYIALFLIKTKIRINGIDQYKILTYFSHAWESFFIVNRRYDPNSSVEDQFPDFGNKLSELIGVRPEDLCFHYDKKCDFENIKFSYSEKKDALYCYRFMYVKIDNNQNYPYLIQNTFNYGPIDFRWMSIPEMKKDAKTYERNTDVIRFLTDCFDELYLIPPSF